MGFTTLIAKNLPVGIKINKQCKTSPMLLIMDVAKLKTKRNKMFLKLILPLKHFIGKGENADLDHFTSKPFTCKVPPLLVRCLRYWPNNKPAKAFCLVFAGN